MRPGHNSYQIRSSVSLARAPSRTGGTDDPHRVLVLLVRQLPNYDRASPKPRHIGAKLAQESDERPYVRAIVVVLYTDGPVREDHGVCLFDQVVVVSELAAPVMRFSNLGRFLDRSLPIDNPV
jgi:hypothetical protein